MLSTDTVTAQFQASVQAKLQTAGSDAQAQLYAKTGVDTNQAKVKQGAISAVGLLQNGYNPANDSDNANLVHAISGGLCLVPAIGPLLGAAVEGLWAVGNAVGCPLENAFASIGFGSPSPACGGVQCKSSGDWTAATIMQASALPAMPTGSFASIVIPAIAMNSAESLNCKSGMPPGQVVDAIAAIWNHTHAGPAIDYFIPPLAGAPDPTSQVITGTATIIPFWQNVSNSTTGNVDPNVYFAFQPVSSIAAKLNDSSSNVSTYFATYFPAASGLWSVSPGRIVSLNSGPLLTDMALSTASSIAKHAAVVGGGAVLGGLIYAWVSGKAVNAVFEGAFGILKGWVGTAAGEVEGSLAAAETRGRRRRR
jgi:hypothetical protein